MANTYTDPHSSAAILPDPSATSSGMVIKAETPSRVGNLTNYLIANAGAGQPVISQSWAEDCCAWNGATIQICEWRVPVLSSIHQDLTIQINAAASASLGTVTIHSALNAATVSVNINSAVDGWYDATLNIGAPGAATYDTITMSLAAAAGDVDVNSITISYTPLTSPLAAGTSTTGGKVATPMGTTSLGIDYPLTSSRGHELVNTLDAINRRPRVISNWSGLTGNQAYKPRAGEHWMWDQTVGQRQRGQAWAEARAQGVSYVLHANIDETIGFPRVVQWAEGQVSNILAGQSGWITLTWSALDVSETPPYWGYPLISDEMNAAPYINIEVGGGATLIIAPVKSFVYWEVIT